MRFALQVLSIGVSVALLTGPTRAQEAAPIAPGINLEGIVENDNATPGFDLNDSGFNGGSLDGGGLEFQEQDNPQLVSPDVASYQFYITDLESRQGAYAPGLSEQLLGLGMAYQNQGLHKEAVKVFKRAVHLARINTGLYSEEQIPILQQLISSHMAAGEYGKADERQYYLYRVQRRVYGRNTGAMSTAMLERAQWERQAYHLAVGETSFTRLLTMWELYRAALSNIAELEGQYSNSLVKPLRGLLQTQYLIAEYEGEATPTFEVNGGGGEQNSLAQNRFSMLRNTNYRQGTAVITALRDVYVYNEEESSPKPALATLELGDWQLWYQKRENAWKSYQQAWSDLAGKENGDAILAEHFGRPVMLPNISGAHADLDPPANVSGYVVVSYGVNAQGRVTGLKMLEKQLTSAETAKSPIRLMRRLKSKRFRPRFEGGERVATEGIVEQYAF